MFIFMSIFFFMEAVKIKVNKEYIIIKYDAIKEQKNGDRKKNIGNVIFS